VCNRTKPIHEELGGVREIIGFWWLKFEGLGMNQKKKLALGMYKGTSSTDTCDCVSERKCEAFIKQDFEAET